MQKTPTYIGIFAVDPKDAAHKLTDFTKNCLEIVVGNVDSAQAQQDMANFDYKFSLPKDNHHITTLFIGGNEKALKGPHLQHYKSFKAGEKVNINIQLCVYVPGSIVVGYCMNIENQDCGNKYPHVTLFLSGGTKPVESNAVLEQVFAEEPGLMKQDFQFKEAKAKYKGKSVYLIKKEIVLKGVTGNNFVFGSRK